MRVLVKLGGTLLDSPDSRAGLAAQIAALPSTGVELVVVHGGGKQMTRFLKERGVESRFVNGLRVTSPDVIDAVLKVFAGSVNKELVSSLIAAGAPAVGLSGIDGALAEARQLNPELGAVGEIFQTNPAVLNALVEHGFIPVVACVAGDRAGAIYNVNADQMAVACAAGYQAARLLFLTDVDGVRVADGTTVPVLDVPGCQELIAQGVATGGMQAKLNSACAALAQGVGEVIIAPGSAPRVIERLLNGEVLGTRIVKEAQQ
ncbi:acetylglutamate kinase [Paludibaculum fermentans]|uniref:acetylglutamate kinase n=1 Tax=Paludibaculum fermentans TaxID=1473598 RepID=UPI003EBA7AC4